MENFNRIQPNTDKPATDLGWNKFKTEGVFDEGQAKLEVLQAKFSLGDIRGRLASGESKADILAEVNRPIDDLYFGRQAEPGEDAFLAACQAQRNTDFGKMNDYHYNKILAAAINNEDKIKHPEFVDALDYKTLVERYQTAADFQSFVDSFMARINHTKNTPAKIAEYTSDMNKFGELVFGDQWELWKNIKEL